MTEKKETRTVTRSSGMKKSETCLVDPTNGMIKFSKSIVSTVVSRFCELNQFCQSLQKRPLDRDIQLRFTHFCPQLGTLNCDTTLV